MTLRPVNNENDDTPEVGEAVVDCPICGGKMEKVYDRHHTTVCVCVDCHTGLSVPASAWNVARLKIGGKSA